MTDEEREDLNTFMHDLVKQARWWQWKAETLEKENEKLKAENAALREAFKWALGRADDVCGKCAYYIPPQPNEEYTSCNHEGECAEGILAHFKQNG